MAELVTLDEVRDHLMVDNSAVNPWIEMMIPAISQAVLLWLKDDWRAYETMVDSNGKPLEDSAGDQFPILDSNGEPIPKPVVKAATLIEIAVQFRFRDGTDYDQTATGDLYSGRYGYILSRGPTALLHGLRRPTLT